MALYNIVMKLRNKFDIQKWQQANEEKRKEWRKHWQMLKWHPLPWFIIMVVVAYSLEGCGITGVR